MTGGSHLGEVLRWAREESTDWASMAAAGLGMAGPLLVAEATGNLNLGLAAAVGSLLMGNSSTGRTVADLARTEAGVLATLAAACAMVALIAGRGLASDILLVAIATVAAVVGGYSRGWSMATGRFVVFLVVTFSVANGHAHGLALFPLIGLAAVWTSALIVGFGAIARRLHPPAPLAHPSHVEGTAPAERRARWLASLATLAGWQFPIRLAVCLGAGVAVAAAFPRHHSVWIVLTVALVCQRPLEPWPVRTTQRALGTLIGVLAAGLALGRTVPDAILIAVLSGLSFIRLGVRSRNYLVFSACMTPVVMLILDAGRPVELALLVDRVVATAIGAALVIGVNQAMWRRVRAGSTAPTGTVAAP